MKKKSIIPVLVMALIFSACSTSNKSTTVWVNKEKIQGKTFGNFFIIVMTADIQAKVQLEKDLADIAIAKGYKAVKSIDVMPQDLNDPKIPSKEEVVSKVKASGCDAVFVASLLNKTEEIRRKQGEAAYSGQAPIYSWTGDYYSYYSHWYPTVATPDYYSKEKEYFIQSNLYDVQSAEIMWSVQSQLFNPSSLKSFSKSYTSDLISQLQKQKLLKK